jgi:hypothetical protein
MRRTPSRSDGKDQARAEPGKYQWKKYEDDTEHYPSFSVETDDAAMGRADVNWVVVSKVAYI